MPWALIILVITNLLEYLIRSKRSRESYYKITLNKGYFPERRLLKSGKRLAKVNELLGNR